MRRRLPRIVLNAATVASLALCAATLVLWARSHSRGGSIVHHTVDSPNRRAENYVLDYESGRVNIYRTTWTFEPAPNLQPALDALAATPRWRWRDTVTYTYANPSPDTPASLGFRYHHHSASNPQTLHVRPSPYRGTVTTTEQVVGFPHWFAALILFLPAARGIPHLCRRLHPARPGTCPTCGYDLRATPARCPECGTLPAR